MQQRYIADLKAGDRVESQTFLVLSKDLRTTTQGSLYIHAVLADRTGQVLARAWSASEAMYNLMPVGGFIDVKGRSESYKGNLQFIIEAIRPVDRNSIDLGDFLPRSPHDIDEMWSRTVEILRLIRDKYLQAIIAEFLKDEQRIKMFKNAPAAIEMHHAYIGGLCEHTLNLLELAVVVIPRYPDVSLDLVLAGLFLHDIGKTVELGFATSFEYTDEGQLVGHIAICSAWIEQMAARASETLGEPFPDRTKWMLQHIVLAHHGRGEFGSPRTPAIPEAFAVHYLDNLDAKLNMSLGVIAKDRDQERSWTTYHRGLETRMFKHRLAQNQD